MFDFRSTIEVCLRLNITFAIPSFIVQDASYAEANAAIEVFGSTVTIVMCWFHLVFNVKKHLSFTKLKQEYRDMILVDLTRLHYCLQYEYEPFKKIVLAKWANLPDLKEFMEYVVPQWFEGMFSNWHIWLLLCVRISSGRVIIIIASFKDTKLRELLFIMPREVGNLSL